MDRQTARNAILEAKRAQGVSWSQIASEIGMAPVWTAALALGEASATEDIARKLCLLLGLDDAVAAALQRPPLKGQNMDRVVPTDPLLYRFYEILSVFGPALKECIHEEFGDGIMSAIDFTVDVERDPAPDGDRVRVVMNGKFLPYKRW